MVISEIKTLQPLVQSYLENLARSQRIANLYLFIGPNQCGKTTCAREFFQLLNAQSSKNHPDFFQLIPDKSIKIAQVRMLQDFVKFGPRMSNYLMVLIEHGELFTKEAANAFLKTLEEPPPRVVFIIETDQRNSLLPTIVSRAQLVNFRELTSAMLLQVLSSEGLIASELDLLRPLELTNLQTARYYLENQEQLRPLSDLENFSQSELLLLAEELAKAKKEALPTIFDLLQHFYRHSVEKQQVLVKYRQRFNHPLNNRLFLEALFLELRRISNGRRT